MENDEEEITDEVWIKFLRNHWKMTIIIAAGIVVAAVCGFLLFLWFILPNTFKTNILQKSLSFWTVGFALSFILNVVLWEFLFIGIPVIVCAILIFTLWWRNLPEDEREDYTGEEKKDKNRQRIKNGGGGGLSFLVFITWLIIVYADNQWNTFFMTWSFEYLIFSCISAFLWDLLIFGVPIGVIGLIWILYTMKEK